MGIKWGFKVLVRYWARHLSMWEREKVKKKKEWMFTSLYCAWNIPCDHLHEQPWAKFIICAAHWHQWHYSCIKDIHIIVGLILAFLRRTRLRADCCERKLKDLREERFSNQKEDVVFSVGSSWEPGDLHSNYFFFISKGSVLPCVLLRNGAPEGW